MYYKMKRVPKGHKEIYTPPKNCYALYLKGTRQQVRI